MLDFFFFNCCLLHISLWFAPVEKEDLPFIVYTHRPLPPVTHNPHMYTFSNPIRVPSWYYWLHSYVHFLKSRATSWEWVLSFWSNLPFPGDANCLLQSSFILLIQYYLSTPPSLWHNSYPETAFKFPHGNSLFVSQLSDQLFLQSSVFWFLGLTSLLWWSFCSGSSLSSLGKGKKQIWELADIKMTLPSFLKTCLHIEWQRSFSLRCLKRLLMWLLNSQCCYWTLLSFRLGCDLTPKPTRGF